jgi:hypothetical protein
MQAIDKILALSGDDRVKLGDEFKSLLHTHLVLGQTRWVCRYGTLSDGHEKITPAQRYYQAIKEMYALSQNIKNVKAQALIAEADHLDAKAELIAAVKQSDKLRADAKIMMAETKLMNCLVTIEDQLRMLDEYNTIRLELKTEVETKYPEGIEQAEKDNWMAVYHYRMYKSQTPGLAKEVTSNVPLPQDLKAELGAQWGRMDSIASFAVNKPKLADNLMDKYFPKLEKKHV